MSALGTVGITSLKGVAIAVLLGGVIGVPVTVFAGGGDKRTGIERTHDKWANNNLLTSGFALSTKEGSTDFGISFKDSVSFNPKEGMKATQKSFNDVKMVFDNHVLQKGDVLFSPDQNGIYYLAKWEKDKQQYRLQNGQTTKRLLHWTANWKDDKNKHIKLTPKSQYGNSIPTISLETCTFTQVSENINNNTDWKIRMICFGGNQYLRFREAPRVEAILSKENFNEVFGKKK